MSRNQYLEDLTARRRGFATQEAERERLERETAKRRRLMLWLGFLPFLAFLALSLYSGARLNGYLQGWHAAKAGKSIEEGLRSP